MSVIGGVGGPRMAAVQEEDVPEADAPAGESQEGVAAHSPELEEVINELVMAPFFQQIARDIQERKDEELDVNEAYQ